MIHQGGSIGRPVALRVEGDCPAAPLDVWLVVLEWLGTAAGVSLFADLTHLGKRGLRWSVVRNGRWLGGLGWGCYAVSREMKRNLRGVELIVDVESTSGI